MDSIKSFDGEYYFLSNFYESPVTVFGMTFRNVEAAFHSQKDPYMAQAFTTLDPSAAKRIGRQVKLRPDWEAVKDQIMSHAVARKFLQDETLRRKLMETGNAHLEEGNTWGDRYWGTVNGEGQNKLGIILMSLRDFFR